MLTQAPTETHRVARGGVQVVVARAAFYGLAYFSILMLARGLGPVQYGIYGLVISVVGWIEQVAQSTLAPATFCVSA